MGLPVILEGAGQRETITDPQQLATLAYEQAQGSSSSPPWWAGSFGLWLLLGVGLLFLLVVL